MKKLLYLLLSFVFITDSFSQTRQKLDEVLDAYARQYKFNGTVLVAKKGEILLEKGYGFRNIKPSIPNDENSIFQIGSVTKQFTAVIILKLQEQGKLSVKDKLSKYFPDYPNGDKITIENLLTHTSGIYNYTNNASFMKNEVSKSKSRDSIIALFRDQPLNFEPGSKFSYSNSGYSLLGYIIEKVTNKPYEKVMREMILQPLNMDNSGFDFTHLKVPGKASGYFYIAKDSNQVSPIVDSTVSFSAGSLFSTVGDLYKWDRAISSGKILSAGSWKSAFTPFLSKYGYGWHMDTIYGKPVISHSGGIHGFSSIVTRFPEEDAVIILLNNGGTPNLTKISNDLAAVLFNKTVELPGAKTEMKFEENFLKQYEGEYQLTQNFSIRVWVENGKLMAQATGQQAFELFAESETKFFLKVVDAQLEFVKDDKGAVQKLILYQNGMKVEGKKI